MAWNTNRTESLDKIDFPKVLWEALKDMRESLFKGDMASFSYSIQALEVLLTPKIERKDFVAGEIYKKQYKQFEEIYRKEILKAGNSAVKRHLAEYNKLLAWSKAIVMLIDNAGYMPEETSGLYGKREDDDD